MTHKQRRLLFNVLNNCLSGLIAVMLTIDFINQNYGMAIADALIGVGHLILRIMAALYLESTAPNNTPPTQQVELDKDDAA